MLAQKAEINYDKTLLSASQVVCYINDLGFESRIIEDDAGSHSKLELHVSLNIFNGNKLGLVKCFSNCEKILNSKKLPLERSCLRSAQDLIQIITYLTSPDFRLKSK